MLWLWFGVAVGAAPPPSSEGVAEPILELAERDVRAVRTARGAFVLGCAAPAVAIIGRLALTPLLETPFGAQTAGAAGLLVVGAGGMVAAPIWLDSRARRSRNALRQQGLQVRGLAPALVTGVFAVAAPALLIGDLQPGNDAPPEAVAGALASYTAAMGLGVTQLNLNRAARVESGWLVVGPTAGAPGVAVSGSW